jgi:hypothetical protein
MKKIRTRKGSTTSTPGNHLAVVQIFGIENLAMCGFGGGNNQGVPIRDSVIADIPFIRSRNVRHSGMLLAGIQSFAGCQLKPCWHDDKEKRYFYKF